MSNHRRVLQAAAGVVAIIVLLMAGSAGCQRSAESSEPAMPTFWHSVAEVDASIEQHLKAAEVFRQQIIQVRGKRTAENTLVPYNNILIEMEALTGPGDLMANVHPDEAVREAADTAYQKGSQYLNDIDLDSRLYEALKQVPTEGMDSETQRFLMLTLRNYQRAGADKDEATRQKLADIYGQMVSTGQDFDRNLRESRRYIDLNSLEDLAGLPGDYAASLPPGPDGKIRISTDYADYDPFMLYSSREDLRRALFIQFNQRAYPENEPVLKQLLSLRYQYATLLGYPTWAEYQAEDKMVKNTQTISDFIENTTEIARIRWDSDIAQILARKKMDQPDAEVVDAWDANYYTRIIRQEQYGVDSEKVRSYFELNRVINGIVQLAQDVFGVTIKRVKDSDVWDNSVRVYDVYDEGYPAGRLYLDLHPRQDKYSHEALFATQTGLKDRQVAVAALVANLPGPGTAEQPALLDWQDARSIFFMSSAI
jgi:thimet oligopeptidase